MARRIIGIALALFVAAAPAAAELCAADCAEHARHFANPSVVPVDDVAQHASHHHHHPASRVATPMTSAGVRSVPHTCGLADTLATQSRETVRTAVEKSATLLAAIFVPAPVATPLAGFVVAGRHGPPGPVRTIAPLRI